MDIGSVATSLRWFGVAALLAGFSAPAQNRTVTNLGAIAGSQVLPLGINNSGQVVGYATGDNAFVYSGGSFGYLGTPFPPPGTYHYSTHAYAINDGGQVAGDAITPAYPYADGAFLYSDTMIALPTFLTNSSAYAINNSGQIVGAAWDASSYYSSAFFYSRGSYRDLGHFPGVNTQPACHRSIAYGINNNEQVVGLSNPNYSEGASQAVVCNLNHAFLSSGGNMIDLDPGDYGSVAYGINDNGQIVGSATPLAGGGSYAFLATVAGAIKNLGTLGGTQSVAKGINRWGQVVGNSLLADNVTQHAFLYSGDTMIDLNTLLPPNSGWVLSDATAINDAGQIVGTGTSGYDFGQLGASGYLLGPGPLTFSNPYASSISSLQAPGSVDLISLQDPKNTASKLAADGISAVVVEIKSASSSEPVTFTLVSSGNSLSFLGPFDPNYLMTPNPDSAPLTITAQAQTPCDTTGCTFLALLWAPSQLPKPVVFLSPLLSSVPIVTLTVTATQNETLLGEGSISLVPPPLLLVHGLWSSAKEAGFLPGLGGFYDWIARLYPHDLISAADYGNYSYLSFTDSSIQGIFHAALDDVLAKAAREGTAARRVDVVGHSMGGLVTRFFMSKLLPANPELLPNSIHKLITIGSPHQGTPLAAVLYGNQADVSVSPAFLGYCSLSYPPISPCTLANVFASFKKKVDTGVRSFVPLSTANGDLALLSPSSTYSAIVGLSPAGSSTEAVLNSLIGGFIIPAQTVGGILGPLSDTIVPAASQLGYTMDYSSISNVVHTRLPGDWVTSLGTVLMGETASVPVWNQALYWLTGGVGPVPTNSPAPAVLTRNSVPAANAPSIDLTGYTQVSTSNATISPASGSALTIGSSVNIAAISSTKTIIEIMLLQSVTDPADAFLLLSTQSPFNIAFTPTHLGSANFIAFAVFSDRTYAVTTLTYTVQLPGTPVSIALVNTPIASMAPGTSRIVSAQAVFSTGLVDVTQAAAYSTLSGGSTVFSVGSGGVITATGNGTDVLDVSWEGVSASAPISVGACSYNLGPPNQLIPYTGGTVNLQVTAPAGCVWTATGGANWLTNTNISGTGNGTISLTAAPNGTGTAQVASISILGVTARITQPATACTYGLSVPQVTAPATGASGSITVTTTCPVVVSSSANFVTATSLGLSVNYTVSANPNGAQRIATITIGDQDVTVTQAGSLPPASGRFSITVTYDATVPKDAQAAFNSVVSRYESLFANVAAVTVNVTFGATELGESSSSRQTFPYGAWRAALIANATANPGNKYETAAAASLPASDPLGNGLVSMATANARALGLILDTALDSNLTFSDSVVFEYTGVAVSGAYDFIGVAAHELDEALGIGSVLSGLPNNSAIPSGDYQPEDYFRYSAPAKLDITTNPNAVVYFSYDGGHTNVAVFNQDNNAAGAISADRNDWAFYGCPANPYYVQDAVGCPDQAVSIGTAPETIVLNSLGYNPVQSQGTQSITFGGLGNISFSGTLITVAASASSGLEVTFLSTTTPVCTVSGSVVTLVAIGLCSISASQAGNSNFSAAVSVIQSFTISQGTQEIIFPFLATVALPVSPFSLTAFATSGLPVDFTSTTPDACSVGESTLTPLGAGNCSITASQGGNALYAPALPVTQTFLVTAPVQPVAAFLDQNGAPALTFNGSTSFPDAGGFLIGAPGVTQDLYGNTYVVGLDSAGGVHLNSYSSANSTWNGWQYSGGILDTSSGLTAAVDPGGIVWFTGRDIGNRFWINSWNGNTFGGWILLDQGIFAGDSIPQIAISSDGSIYVIGKDIGGRIWSNSYNPTNQTFTGWVDRQAVMIGQPSATAGQDGMVYVSVRNSATNSPVYIKQIPAQNAAGNTWLNGGGLIDTDPQITSEGGTIYLTALAGGGTVYLLTFTESNQAFGTWTFTNGTLQDETIATAAGNVFIAGRDSSDRIYWYSVTGNNWFLAGGAGLSSTVLTGAK